MSKPPFAREEMQEERKIKKEKERKKM